MQAVSVFEPCEQPSNEPHGIELVAHVAKLKGPKRDAYVISAVTSSQKACLQAASTDVDASTGADKVAFDQVNRNLAALKARCTVGVRLASFFWNAGRASHVNRCLFVVT